MKKSDICKLIVEATEFENQLVSDSNNMNSKKAWCENCNEYIKENLYKIHLGTQSHISNRNKSIVEWRK